MSAVLAAPPVSLLLTSAGFERDCVHSMYNYTYTQLRVLLLNDYHTYDDVYFRCIYLLAYTLIANYIVLRST